MSKIEMTYELAMAASRDAGNRSMREGNRTVWAVKDWNVACETFERLYPDPRRQQIKPEQPHQPRNREGRGR